MLRITLIAVGSIKEKYHQQAIEEYWKRLGLFCKLDVIEISEMKIIDETSSKLVEAAKTDETARQIARIPENSKVIVLDSRGEQIESTQLAISFSEWASKGHSHFVFLIGGSHGFSNEIDKISAWKWSFSKLTFTHQMMRVMLLEQIYRAFKINRGDSYHK
jgi:23S rRNA (pseudouridine1915-N3)-methyltransferase